MYEKNTRREDEYYPPKISKHGNITVRVYCPIITDEEQERRMKRIYDATTELLKESIRAKHKARLAKETVRDEINNDGNSISCRA